jgi:hypothetical protein
MGSDQGGDPSDMGDQKGIRGRRIKSVSVGAQENWKILRIQREDFRERLSEITRRQTNVEDHTSYLVVAAI